RRHTRAKRDWSSDVCSSDLSLTATTAATTRWPTSAEESAVKITAREISASRLNQSPRLDRESEIHNLRKDVIARTLCASVGAPKIGRASCRERGSTRRLDGR